MRGPRTRSVRSRRGGRGCDGELLPVVMRAYPLMTSLCHERALERGAGKQDSRRFTDGRGRKGVRLEALVDPTDDLAAFDVHAGPVEVITPPVPIQDHEMGIAIGH